MALPKTWMEDGYQPRIELLIADLDKGTDPGSFFPFFFFFNPVRCIDLNENNQAYLHGWYLWVSTIGGPLGFVPF